MTPAAALADKARSMLGIGDDLALCTDAHSHENVVLVAIARPGASCVVQVPRASYCGLALMRMAGWADEPAPVDPPDPEKLLKEIRHARKR